MLSSFAMGFVGSMVANSFFSAMGGFGSEGDSDGDAGADETANNAAPDAGWDGDGADFGGGDFDV
jgi:hypothetical protein